MDFTYEAYVELIKLLKDKGYDFCSYLNYDKYKKTVIFRHDIDNSLEKALEIAKIEHENNITSTFFVLLSTNFYNVFSKESNDILKEIIALGHEIGLHFDEKRYEISSIKELEYWVVKESKVLEEALGEKVKSVSMHRPSKWILENDIYFEGIINSYSKKFLSDFKYLSDSRMHWREDVIAIVDSEVYDRLHILTHAFWYADNNENMEEKLKKFIGDARKERYYYLKDNIRDIEEIISEFNKKD
ncbi:hypothetical protein [Clostridium algidicarnis]|uniref:Polysaccharide deacetylase n=1 Tax=Clostridium algidicarnis TaxID=37659 RepID=A0ABS6C591_9CLOT|nr:hypothetical protein [Clostridium algidicarnis]MBU3220662.1 hypothetical protein [Clostridium algidicarnis]